MEEIAGADSEEGESGTGDENEESEASSIRTGRQNKHEWEE